MSEALFEELERRAREMISTGGTPSPGPGDIHYVMAGRYSAALHDGVIKIGVPHEMPFYDSRWTYHSMAESAMPGFWEDVLESFRRAMLLDDLSNV